MLGYALHASEIPLAPVVPGIVLIAIAAFTALSRNVVLPEELLESAWRLWPWALVAAGIALMVQAMRRRKQS